MPLPHLLERESGIRHFYVGLYMPLGLGFLNGKVRLHVCMALRAVASHVVPTETVQHVLSGSVCVDHLHGLLPGAAYRMFYPWRDVHRRPGSDPLHLPSQEQLT